MSKHLFFEIIYNSQIMQNLQLLWSNSRSFWEPLEAVPTEIKLHCCWISDCVLDTDLFNYSLSQTPSVRAPHRLPALSKRLKESTDIVLQGHA